MAIIKNTKDRPEESFWKPVFNKDMLFRIKDIVEQTGLSPSDLFLKWILQEEALIGLTLRNKGETAEQAKTRPRVISQKIPVAQEKSAEAVPLKPSNPNYRKTLAKRIKQLKKEGMTLKKIAEIFNDETIPTVSGTGKWYSSSIANLMNSRK